MRHRHGPRTTEDSGLIQPLWLPGLALWIDFADASTITTGVGGISQADDKSGNGYHLAQGTSGNRPDYSGTLNGRNIATFAGGPDLLTRSTGTAVGKNASGCTSYVVFKHTSSPTTDQRLLSVQGPSSSLRHYLRAGATSNKLEIIARRLDADANAIIVGSTNVGTGWHIATAVADNVAGTLGLWMDGASEGSTTLASSGGNSSNTDTAVVQLSSANASLDLVGNVAECLVYNAAHDSATRSQVWAYLRNKWGL